jgi:hypothetical protein
MRISLIVLAVSASALGCSSEDAGGADAAVDAAAHCTWEPFDTRQYPLADAEGVADGGTSACRMLCASHLSEVQDGYGVETCQILGALDQAPELACTFTLTATPQNDPCFGK